MSARRDVLVIGAGQAGLAIGHHLAAEGRDFLIVDAAAERRRMAERWDSLRLFTPAQYDNLPGLPFPAGTDRYPTHDEVGLPGSVRRAFDLPIRFNTRVTAVDRATTATYAEVGDECCGADQVVIATGPFQAPLSRRSQTASTRA